MVKHHKGKLMILDGLGDRGIPACGGKTLLETVGAPNLDHLAVTSQIGLVDLVPNLLFVPQGQVDQTLAFAESDCSHGGLGRVNSSGFLSTMLNHIIFNIV